MKLPQSALHMLDCFFEFEGVWLKLRSLTEPQ